MSAAEPPAGAVTTFTRTRHVLARLLEPWVWALAGLGAVLIAVPGPAYQLPPERHPARPGGAGPPSNLNYADVVDWRVRAHPAAGVWVGAPDSGISVWHGRAVTGWLSREKPGPPPAPAASADWTWRSEPWGLRVRRGEQTYESARPPRTFEMSLAAVGIGWLAGLPLLWSLVRLWIGVRGGWGDPQPAGRWRRVSRPWAATLVSLAAAAVWAGGGLGERETGPTVAEVKVTVAARRSPFTPLHPRFLRVVVDRPDAAPPDDAAAGRGRFRLSPLGRANGTPGAGAGSVWIR